MSSTHARVSGDRLKSLSFPWTHTRTRTPLYSLSIGQPFTPAASTRENSLDALCLRDRFDDFIFERLGENQARFGIAWRTTAARRASARSNSPSRRVLQLASNHWHFAHSLRLTAIFLRAGRAQREGETEKPYGWEAGSRV